MLPAENGDRIPDFSAAGYGPAGAPLPRVPEAARVAPTPDGADRAAIQEALDAVAARVPSADGSRGAVVLAAGTYRLDGTLTIGASGVVLRGSGSGPGGTVLLLAGPPGPLVEIVGTGRRRPAEPPRRIVDAYVPVGAEWLTLQSADGLSVGDPVIVQRPFTAAFIAEIGMDRIPPREGRQINQWKPSHGLLAARTIVAIEGDRVHLDAPVVDAIRAEDGGSLWRYDFPGELTEVAVEGLSLDGTLVAPPTGTSLDEVRALRLRGIVINKAANAWVRDVRFRNLSDYVVIETLVREATLEDVHGVNDVAPWSPVPTAAFSIDGERILVRRCSLVGARMLLVTTQSLAAGPNVFQNCRGTGERVSAGPHQRWAAGILFDNVTVSGAIEVADRGNMGSGQGWAGANVVVWNSAARGFLLASPPTAYTWMFGGQGELRRMPGNQPVVVSPMQRVEPQSLFDAQLEAATR